MDFPKGLFTLTVAEGTTLTPSAIRKAVQKRFDIPSIEVVGMRGKVAKNESKTVLAAVGQKAKYALMDKKDKKAVAKLEDGGSVLVSGKLTEKTVGKKTQLVIEVSEVKAAKKKA